MDIDEDSVSALLDALPGARTELFSTKLLAHLINADPVFRKVFLGEFLRIEGGEDYYATAEDALQSNAEGSGRDFGRGRVDITLRCTDPRLGVAPIGIECKTNWGFQGNQLTKYYDLLKAECGAGEPRLYIITGEPCRFPDLEGIADEEALQAIKKAPGFPDESGNEGGLRTWNKLFAVLDQRPGRALHVLTEGSLKHIKEVTVEEVFQGFPSALRRGSMNLLDVVNIRRLLHALARSVTGGDAATRSGAIEAWAGPEGRDMPTAYVSVWAWRGKGWISLSASEYAASDGDGAGIYLEIEYGEKSKPKKFSLETARTLEGLSADELSPESWAGTLRKMSAEIVEWVDGGGWSKSQRFSGKYFRSPEAAQ